MSLNRREFLYLAAGLLAGCGVTNREPDYTIVIERDSTFNPSTLVVPKGTRIAWHNQGTSVHTITTNAEQAETLQSVALPAGASPFDSGDLFPGDRWVYAFDVPGTYVYFSRYRQSNEMFGLITVTT